MFPDAPYAAERPDAGQRFRIAIEPDDAAFLGDASVRMVVSIEPAGGTGEGARITLGGIALE
jgi:hypothetical protein